MTVGNLKSYQNSFQTFLKDREKKLVFRIFFNPNVQAVCRSLLKACKYGYFEMASFALSCLPHNFDLKKICDKVVTTAAFLS